METPHFFRALAGLVATAILATGIATSPAQAASARACEPYPSYRDYTCDGKPDLFAQDSHGMLWTYPGNGDGGFRPRIRSGTGWRYTAIVGFATPRGTGVFARDKAGNLWSYPSNDHGGWGKPNRAGGGWNQMTSITNEKSDLLAIDRSGTLWRYPYWFANNDIRTPIHWSPRQRLGTGWAGRMLVESDGAEGADFLARDTKGTLWPYFFDKGQLHRAVFSFGSGWNRYTRIVMAGDFENYGWIEFAATDQHGDLWLYRTRTSPRVKIGHGFNGYTVW